jgi:hypothetical protein
MTDTMNGHAVTRRRGLEIAHDWTTDELRTIEDCERAKDTLLAAISKMRTSLKLHEEGDPEPYAGWARKARIALHLKTITLQRVEDLHAKLRGDTPERRLLEIVKDLDAEVYDRGLAKARKLYPNFSI